MVFSRICKTFQRYGDPFSHTVAPTSHDGVMRVTSCFGCLTGLAIIVLMALYINAKQYARDDSDSGRFVVEPTLRGYFDESFTFTSKEGFQLAFGLAEYAD